MANPAVNLPFAVKKWWLVFCNDPGWPPSIISVHLQSPNTLMINLINLAFNLLHCCHSICLVRPHGKHLKSAESAETGCGICVCVWQKMLLNVSDLLQFPSSNLDLCQSPEKVTFGRSALSLMKENLALRCRLLVTQVWWPQQSWPDNFESFTFMCGIMLKCFGSQCAGRMFLK